VGTGRRGVAQQSLARLGGCRGACGFCSSRRYGVALASQLHRSWDFADDQREAVELAPSFVATCAQRPEFRDFCRNRRECKAGHAGVGAARATEVQRCSKLCHNVAGRERNENLDRCSVFCDNAAAEQFDSETGYCGVAENCSADCR